jgi:predicted ATPase/signal transduction histidine kinase/tRNA A-37 threonylcarbamoyl transferase component Bud32
MENVLSEYDIGDRIHQSSRSLVYRARRQRDGVPVVIKIQQTEHPSPDELARFRREYEVGLALRVEGVVKPYGLARYKNRLALVMEDLGGESLRARAAARPLGVEEILGVAVQVARTLGQIHQRRVIHKDVNPANIIVHPETGVAKLIDFGIATTLTRESPTAGSPDVLEGTLRYVSPEQTGRMNRAIDYRTDFYSFGVTLYELLTGTVPFLADDAMELVHCHLAREPVAPHLLRPELPAALSAIVLKLLAKMAEDRYQSGLGLATDLAECLASLRATGRIEGFVPGRHDVSDRFQIPQKLYGREADLEVLLAMFDRISRGKAELMLVAGYSGVGKSALVNEIHKPIVQKRGHFVSGKFDQLKRNVPYASLIEAFQDLVRQLLAESESRLATWRHKLAAALGRNAGVIAEVIPAVELILGEQPPAPPLPPTESQNRFNFVFQRFVAAFAAADHPLVIFLDDLQWADLPSLKLIQLLLTDAGLTNLAIIGAYRDNEVSGAHPLLSTLEAIRGAGTQVTTLDLVPLDLGQVTQLVGETLRCGRAAAAPLATLLLQKTQGNPFFLGQFLGALHEEGLIAFDAAASAWRWDLGVIRGRGLTDNVVDLMAGKIQKLGAPAQHALGLAACIGNRFDLRTLALVARRPAEEMAASLRPAVEEGLVVPLGDGYLAASHAGLEASFKFLHDRVQQAAYSLIGDDGEKRAIHLDLGRLLLGSASGEALDAQIFDVVHQFQLGLAALTSDEERSQVAGLCLAAGKKAKASAAYEPALRYLETGLALLPADAFEARYELAFELHLEGAEAAYLNADFERAQALTDVAMAHTRTVLEKVQILETRMRFHAARNRFEDTIRVGLEALELLGVSLPSAPTPAHFGAALAANGALLAGRPIEDLLDLPELTDRSLLAAQRLLMTLGAPTYIANPLLYILVCAEFFALSVRHGNSRYAPAAYVNYGAIHAGALKDYVTARAYGDLALKLLDRLHTAESKSEVLLLNSVVIRPWTTPLRATLEPLLEAVLAGVETGDLGHGALASVNCCTTPLLAGLPLDVVSEQQVRQLAFMTRVKHEFTRMFGAIARQTLLNLVGLSSDPVRLVGAGFDEDATLPALVEAKNFSTLCELHTFKSLLAYVFGDFAQAATSADLAEQYLPGLAGHVVSGHQPFYQSLAQLALLPSAGEAGRAEALAKVERNQAEMGRWAELCPANFRHKHDLVEAERARAEGRPLEAMALYERAIRGAAEQQYLHEEALANERCADFCRALGWERAAESYLVEAHYAYLRWGASAKVLDLERRHPALLSTKHSAGVAASREDQPVTSSRTGRHSGSSLELSTVMKAAQAISGEIVLDRLVEALMRIIIENAGAQRGFFLLEKDSAWTIEAEWDAGRAEVIPRRGALLAGEPGLSEAIVHYAVRSGESVVLADATRDGLFTNDPYVLRSRPRSVLCAPLLNQGKRIAVIYLENNLTAGAFTEARLEVLRLLSAQAALSIHNATLYATLERKVEERTTELVDKNRELGAALAQLQATQQRLVTQEKLASLGALTAGIAHEIKNPLNFINNFAQLAAELSGQIAESLDAQRNRLDPESLADVDEMLGSLRQGVTKINEHGVKANNIINGMLLHARQVTGVHEDADLNAVLASCVELACHAMRAKDGAFTPELTLDYDPALGKVELSVQDVSRAFVNVLNNALYALREKRRAAGKAFTPRLTVHTKDLGDRAEVRIHDNGTGITPDIAGHIYNPFFTTKPAGEGTGLGLSLSHDIVVQGHHGELTMATAPGEFTEFVITLPKST